MTKTRRQNTAIWLSRLAAWVVYVIADASLLICLANFLFASEARLAGTHGFGLFSQFPKGVVSFLFSHSVYRQKEIISGWHSCDSGCRRSRHRILEERSFSGGVRT
jgi:hypothetical protein